MRHIKIFGLALVAVFALSAAAVSSASAALEFLASKTGLLLGKLIGGKHKFVTEEGTVECATANAHGIISSVATTVQAATVTYGSCEVTAPLKLSATVSPAEYLFLANGTAIVDNPITVNAGSGLCVITVPSQGPLSKILYKNIAGPPMEIELVAEVTGISYSAAGSLCPKKGAFANGTYNGRELVTEDGGDLLID